MAKSTPKRDRTAEQKKGDVVAKAPPKKAGKRKTTPAKSIVKKQILDTLSGASIQTIDASVLDRLYQTVESRRDTDPALSHSARLLSRGKRKVAQKFGEEAVECLIEAVAGNKRELIGESADVLYHLIVMWVDAGVAPDEVWHELQRREGTSGVAEKAARQKIS